MKALIALGSAAIIATTMAASPAVAREGCGRGFHRTATGLCRPDRGTRERWIEGHYYQGRGYWYRNQWHQHRHRRHGVWIYM